MNIFSSFTYWIFLPEVWLILGILLIAADFTIGANFFLLSIGASAFVMGGLIYGQQNLWFGDPLLFETWRQVMIWFSAMSIASVAVIKFLFQRKNNDEPDINEY
jgi:membrane protein implicated in regulation of membrane protease activity